MVTVLLPSKRRGLDVSNTGLSVPDTKQVTLTNPAEAREALDVMVNLVGANNLKAEKVTHTLSHIQTHTHTHKL